MEVVKIFKLHGFEWGGDWKFTDMPHFQKTFGYSVKQLQSKPKPNGYVVI
jgi:peptidoglycan L-alanyl-D-glutamate endopeptidase CwlK